jgi:hypothetical protein
MRLVQIDADIRFRCFPPRNLENGPVNVTSYDDSKRTIVFHGHNQAARTATNIEHTVNVADLGILNQCVPDSRHRHDQPHQRIIEPSQKMVLQSGYVPGISFHRRDA